MNKNGLRLRKSHLHNAKEYYTKNITKIIAKYNKKNDSFNIKYTFTFGHYKRYQREWLDSS